MLLRSWDLARLFEDEAAGAGEGAAGGAVTTTGAVEASPPAEASTAAAEPSAAPVVTETAPESSDERIDPAVRSALDRFHHDRDPSWEIPAASVAPAQTEQAANTTADDTTSGSETGDAISEGQVDPVLVRVAERYGVSPERAEQLGNSGVVAVLEALQARADAAAQQRAAAMAAQPAAPAGATTNAPATAAVDPAATVVPNPAFAAIEKLRAAGDVELADALEYQTRLTADAMAQQQQMQAHMEQRFAQQFQGVNQLLHTQRNQAIIDGLNQAIEGFQRDDLFGKANAVERTAIEKANLAKFDGEFRKLFNQYPQAPVKALAEDAYAFAFRDRLAKEVKQQKVKDLVVHANNVRGVTRSAKASPATEWHGDIRQDPDIKAILQRYRRERGVSA